MKKTINVEPVTIEEIKATEGFEHFSDREAKEYLETMEQYCHLMCQMWLEKENKKSDI